MNRADDSQPSPERIAAAVRQYEVLFYMKNGTQCDIDLVDGADTIMVAESVSRRGLTKLRSSMDRMTTILEAKGIHRLAMAAHSPKGGHAVLVTLFGGNAPDKYVVGHAWREKDRLIS